MRVEIAQGTKARFFLGFLRLAQIRVNSRKVSLLQERLTTKACGDFFSAFFPAASVRGFFENFRKMGCKLLIANITEAISEKNGMRASPPSLDDVQAFLTAADSAPPSERELNTGLRLATGRGDSYVSTEIKRADGGWVHRNYLAR